MEILIYIGVALVLLFAANFFLEVGVAILLSVFITVVTLIGLDWETAGAIVSGEAELLDDLWFVAGVGASLVALLLVWFLEGINLIVLMVLWALFQLPGITATIGFFGEEKVEQAVE